MIHPLFSPDKNQTGMKYPMIYRLKQQGLYFLIFTVTILGMQTQHSAFAASNTPSIRVSSLQCENQQHPMAIDVLHPRLAWISESLAGSRGQYQTAYQIQVASTATGLASGKPDIWDSGKTDTVQSNNILYKGKPLRSSSRYYWRVRVWDKNRIASAWSSADYWETALLNDADWKAKWIADTYPMPADEKSMYDDHPAPLFRKTFQAAGKVKRAVMYVSGIGYYEAYVNGKKAGNALLAPGWTNYAKRVCYNTIDVTDALVKGDNCVGIMLGNGWYNPLPLKMWGRRNIRDALTVGQPQCMLQLSIEYTDGRKEQIVTDDQWKVASGPIIRNSIYIGEVYDARKEINGWNLPGKPAGNWRSVQYSTPPAGKPESQKEPSIIAGQILHPVSIIKKNDGRYMVDFGRNFGGMIRLKARGKSGTAIQAKYGELLYADGSLNVMTSVVGQIKRKGVGGEGAPDTAYAKDVFILSGKGEETFRTHFTFHGFRYVEITGYPGELRTSDIEGWVLYSAVPDAGSFSCSNPLLNTIQEISLRTFRSNIFSVQSDCPQRERFGYGGDIVATCDAFMHNYDMSAFYEKTVFDFADEAQPDGGITELAPYVGIASDGLGGSAGPVEWGAVLPVLLEKLYQYYGNRSLLESQYPVARKWVDFMHAHAKNNLIDITIGDHESVEPKLVGVSATAFYYYNTRQVARFAEIIGRQDDYRRYSLLADSIRSAFIARYVDVAAGKVDQQTPAAQAYGLYFGLVPETARDAALSLLLKSIAEKGNHITAGIFGTRYIMEVLSNGGKHATAYTMATQKTFPGWGYMIANGATTLWEHWALSENTYSHNHPMFGSISDWFYRTIGGIRPAENAVGYNRIVIQPRFDSIQWASASYQSVLGKVSSRWRKDGDLLTLDIHVPVNATAVVRLPAALRNIREGGIPAAQRKDLLYEGAQQGEQIITLGSGDYHFSGVLMQTR
jgi:alpha-L-rhamnosidase